MTEVFRIAITRRRRRRFRVVRDYIEEISQSRVHRRANKFADANREIRRFVNLLIKEY